MSATAAAAAAATAAAAGADRHCAVYSCAVCHRYRLMACRHLAVISAIYRLLSYRLIATRVRDTSSVRIGLIINKILQSNVLTSILMTNT